MQAIHFETDEAQGMKQLEQLKKYAEMLSLQQKLLELKTLQRNAPKPMPTYAGGCTQTYINFGCSIYVYLKLRALQEAA